MNDRRSMAALTLFLPVLLCASAISVAQESRASLGSKIDEIAAAELSKPGGVGLSIAVAQRGRVLHARGYGTADLEFDVPANDETMFRIGSVTKQFTAALVMRLVEQGKLTLDDDLSKFVSEFPLQGRKVTIRQLLQHTSGIKSYTNITERWKKVWPLELSHAELLALVEDAPFDFEPGSDFRYSNTGYYLLGMVIEKVAGRTYAAHLQAELCEPLELRRTRYDSNRDLIRNRAQGYTIDGGVIVNDQPIGMAQPGAAGGIISTARDLVRWQMALTSGKFVSSRSFEVMRSGAELSDRTTDYGMGLELREWEGRTRIQHGGGIFGFNSMLFWLPDDDLHVAVISNGEATPSSRIADAVGHAALGIEPVKVKDEAITAEMISRLSGDFALPKARMDFKVFEREGKLMVQATGQEAFRILWQGGDEFRAEFDNDVRLVFAADGRSMVLFQNGRKAEGVRK